MNRNIPVMLLLARSDSFIEGSLQIFNAASAAFFFVCLARLASLSRPELQRRWRFEAITFAGTVPYTSKAACCSIPSSMALHLSINSIPSSRTRSGGLMVISRR